MGEDDRDEELAEYLNSKYGPKSKTVSTPTTVQPTKTSIPTLPEAPSVPSLPMGDTSHGAAQGSGHGLAHGSAQASTAHGPPHVIEAQASRAKAYITQATRPKQ